MEVIHRRLQGLAGRASRRVGLLLAVLGGGCEDGTGPHSRPESVTLSPTQTTVAAFDTIILAATVRDGSGKVIDLPSVTWTTQRCGGSDRAVLLDPIPPLWAWEVRDGPGREPRQRHDHRHQPHGERDGCHHGRSPSAGSLSDGDARVANCDSDRGHAPVGCDPPGRQWQCAPPSSDHLEQ